MDSSSMSEDQVADLVKNIEETGNEHGTDDGQELQPEKPTGFQFGSLDDLLKHKLEYTVDGRKVEEDLSTILKRASAGYNYAQNTKRLKDEQEQWQQKVKQAEELDQKWSRYEKYAQENPKWFEHWDRAWQMREQGLGDDTGGDSSEIDARLSALLDQRLKPITEFISQQEQHLTKAQMAAEDQKLDDEIKATRTANPSIDFDKTDPETGKSLEDQVLEFASKNGIPSFDAAFKVFYHDNLIALKTEEAKQSWSKEQKRNAKNGIIGIFDEPTKKPSRTSDYSGSSWDQIADFAANDNSILGARK